MITTDVSCRLLEVDFSGIEAVLTGWYQWRHLGDTEGARQYVRLAQLGIHAAVTAVAVGRPANLGWPDDQLQQYLQEIKESEPHTYQRSKRTVHGGNYGLTPYGACEQFPDAFPTLRDAQQFFAFYHTLCPALLAWQTAVRKRAKDVGYLGGPTKPDAAPSIWDHPYGYRHWYWSILNYKPCDEVTARKWLGNPTTAGRIIVMHGRYFKIEWGEDSKRAIAFFPQSTAAGVLKGVELRLFHPESPDYIGDAYFGRTPLLHPIHDSLFLHVPNRIFDRVAAIVVRVMQEPIMELPVPVEWQMGTHLRIGVEAKGGRTWAAMEKIPVDPIVYGAEHPEDSPVMAREEQDQEEWDALGRVVV